MGIDPSIILGVKQPQLDNPLDTAKSVMGMQQAQYQNQMMQRQMSDDQATRSAYQQAMTAGPDGTPTLDRQKLMSTLAQSNPMLAYKQQQELTAQDSVKAKSDMEVDKARHEKASNLAWAIPTDANTPMEVKQAKYTESRNQAIALKLPGAEQSPEQYPGDNFVKQMQLHTLDAQKQAEMQEKQSEFGQREADRKLARDQLGAQKQNQALQQTQTILESAKGNPAVGQAEKDIYAGQKVKSLIAQAGADPNNMNMSMVHLLTSEVGKMASGGVPTVEELKGLTPGNVPQKLSAAAEMFNNHPTPANAGAFIKQMGNYSDAIVKDGQKVIEDKYGRVINTRRAQLGEDNYKNLNSQYVERFKSSAPQSALHSMSDDDLDKAYKAAGGK